MRKKFYSKPFEDGAVAEERSNEPSPATGEFEYIFDGYTIEINEKIVLTPVQIINKNDG